MNTTRFVERIQRTYTDDEILNDTDEVNHRNYINDPHSVTNPPQIGLSTLLLSKRVAKKKGKPKGGNIALPKIDNQLKNLD